MEINVSELLANFASFVWGLPLLILLVGGGFYFLIVSRFLPFRYLGHAIAVLSGKYDNEGAPGQISHFKALSTALASTIGMGNIAGVAVAISLGGPGAIFWMWVSGIIGMATKFFTNTLAILYRGKDSNGELQGGPMYFIREGMGKTFTPLAIMFSFAGLIGSLPMFNVNQLTQALRIELFLPAGYTDTATVNFIIGIFLVIMTSIVIFGGLQRISNTASKLVPAMVLLYVIAVLGILISYSDKVLFYLQFIVQDAFAAEHFKGDPFFGGVLGGLIVHGIRRGAFSNEAGIGTAALAHGAAKTNEPVREGLVAMLGPAIDTLVVCTMTALAILVTDVWQTTADNGVTLTSNAFGLAFNGYGRFLLLLCVISFSVSSLFTYSYYGTKCLSFLIGADKKKYYNYFYILSIMIGAMYPLEPVLNLIDGFFALMAFPTMFAALWLSPKVLHAAKQYFHNIS